MPRYALLVSVAACCGSLAHAGDLTTMMQVPGDWEMTMSSALLPPMTEKACYRGDKSIANLTTLGLKNCSQQSINIVGDHGTVDATCSWQSLRVAVHATVVPTGPASVHADSHVRFEGKPPIPGLPPEMTLSIDAHRLGPCQPGERVL